MFRLQDGFCLCPKSHVCRSLRTRSHVCTGCRDPNSYSVDLCFFRLPDEPFFGFRCLPPGQVTQSSLLRKGPIAGYYLVGCSDFNCWLKQGGLPFGPLSYSLFTEGSLQQPSICSEQNPTTRASESGSRLLAMPGVSRSYAC